MSGKSSVREMSFDLEGVPVASRNRLLVRINTLAEICKNRKQQPRISHRGNLIVVIDLGNLDNEERQAAIDAFEAKIMTILREFSSTNRPLLKS